MPTSNQSEADSQLDPPESTFEQDFYRWACENADDIDQCLMALERLQDSYRETFGEYPRLDQRRNYRDIGLDDIYQGAASVRAGGYVA